MAHPYKLFASRYIRYCEGALSLCSFVYLFLAFAYLWVIQGKPHPAFSAL